MSSSILRKQALSSDLSKYHYILFLSKNSQNSEIPKLLQQVASSTNLDIHSQGAETTLTVFEDT